MSPSGKISYSIVLVAGESRPIKSCAVKAGLLSRHPPMHMIARNMRHQHEMSILNLPMRNGGSGGLISTSPGDTGTDSYVACALQAAAGYVLHIGNLEGRLKVGEKVHAAIDHERRDKIMSNHTSTHVLNHALRELLGEHINQSGSAVDEDRLRFDFTHPKKLEPQEVCCCTAVKYSLVVQAP